MAAARSTASKMTALGSPPSAPRTKSAPHALGPHAELLAGRGPEGVAGGHDHLVPAADLALAQLADGGGLAHAVDADEQPHRRRLRRRSAGIRSKPDSRALSSVLQRVEQLLGVGEPLGLDPGPQRVEQLGGRLDADVGPDQRLLELVPGLVVDPAPGPDRAEVARAAGPRALPSRSRKRGLDGRLGSAGASDRRRLDRASSSTAAASCLGRPRPGRVGRRRPARCTPGSVAPASGATTGRATGPLDRSRRFEQGGVARRRPRASAPRVVPTHERPPRSRPTMTMQDRSHGPSSLDPGRAGAEPSRARGTRRAVAQLPPLEP